MIYFSAEGFLQNLIGQADDLHKVAIPQLSGDSTKNTCPPRPFVFVNQDHCVGVEPDVTAIRTAGGRFGSYNHGPNNGFLFDIAAGNHTLDATDNDVTDPGTASATAAEHLDAHDFASAGVVGNV